MITAYHAKYYAHELTARKTGNLVDRLTYSLVEASVDLNPHQIEAALFALRSPLSKGVMLADEVGLGNPNGDALPSSVQYRALEKVLIDQNPGLDASEKSLRRRQLYNAYTDALNARRAGLIQRAEKRGEFIIQMNELNWLQQDYPMDQAGSPLVRRMVSALDELAPKSAFEQLMQHDNEYVVALERQPHAVPLGMMVAYIETLHKEHQIPHESREALYEEYLDLQRRIKAQSAAEAFKAVKPEAKKLAPGGDDLRRSGNSPAF